MIRLGLCCIFVNEPIKFRRTTAHYLKKFNRQKQLSLLSELVLTNVAALQKAFTFCIENGIGDFRINSQFLPLKTHPLVGYDLSQLPKWEKIKMEVKKCRDLAKENNLRLSFHPDQFVVLSSPHTQVVKNSIAELKYQTQLANMLGADIINIHAGGGYNDKKLALDRFKNVVLNLPYEMRRVLTLENDDKIYTPTDLLPICHKIKIPLVYDVHHHRCLEDGMSIEIATDLAIETWDREPCFHISSPKFGWNSENPKYHHDYIDWGDFPEYWLEKDLTVEVEAKAKELAVLKLKKEIYSYKKIDRKK